MLDGSDFFYIFAELKIVILKLKTNEEKKCFLLW